MFKRSFKISSIFILYSLLVGTSILNTETKPTHAHLTPPFCPVKPVAPSPEYNVGSFSFVFSSFSHFIDSITFPIIGDFKAFVNFGETLKTARKALYDSFVTMDRRLPDNYLSSLFQLISTTSAKESLKDLHLLPAEMEAIWLHKDDPKAIKDKVRVNKYFCLD